jgi:hypothetical protein
MIEIDETFAKLFLNYHAEIAGIAENKNIDYKNSVYPAISA